MPRGKRNKHTRAAVFLGHLRGEDRPEAGSPALRQFDRTPRTGKRLPRDACAKSGRVGWVLKESLGPPPITCRGGVTWDFGRVAHSRAASRWRKAPVWGARGADPTSLSVWRAPTSSAPTATKE